MKFITEAVSAFWESTGIREMFANPEFAINLGDSFSLPGGKTILMYIIIGVLFYLGIVKKFEPLLLLPIATGMLLANITFTPEAALFHPDLFITEGPLDIVTIVQSGNLVDFLYLGVKLGIYPSLIFLGVGAMTDFTALIANPKS